jgi:hypothetical protein
LTNIGYSAFSWCVHLTNITVPNSVTDIPDNAFACCTNLASVTIANGVTSIGSGAFDLCTSLTNVAIPNSVTTVGMNAFVCCSALSSVTIGNSVTNIGENAFQSCTSLRTITVDPANPSYSSADGVLLNNSQTTLLLCPRGKAGSYIVPNSVTNIGYQAFAECYSLTGVTLPDSVISIADSAFALCTNVTCVMIGNNVVSIGDSAFDHCSNLTYVNIPRSVTSIASTAFCNCIGLATITVDALNPTYSSVDGILFDKNRITLVLCPLGKVGSYTILSGVTSIGDGAFYDCSGLTSIMIPTSITSIGSDAFAYCTSLASISIPGSGTSIGWEAFNWCTNLTDLTIGDGVISIGDGAFDLCTSLSRVTIGNSVTNIGAFAFHSCLRLTSISIPDSVTSIGNLAFNYCAGLTSVTIGSNISQIEASFQYCPKLASMYFKGNCPSVDPYLFDGDTNATIYYLPGTTGWGATFGGLPTALWIQPPTILSLPQTQMAEAGSAVSLQVQASSPLPLFYLWYLNNTNLISRSTNSGLVLTGVQFSQAGAYTVVISNVLGAVTSAPAVLQVIAPVERRPVPGVKVMGEAGSVLNVDYADSLSPAPNWTPLGSDSLAGTPQYCFDLTLPLPPQRFYRAWQTGTPNVIPSLDLHLVPAITLTGTIGHSVRLDYINRFGPTDAWVTLATVPLTNTSQLYFDTSAHGQPPRLYRLVPSP